MISATAEYALRATVFLATRKDQLVGRHVIAEETAVPTDYLLKVLNTLDDAGIVESRRGPGGGYRLIRSPGELTVMEVVDAVGEIPRVLECPLGNPEHDNLCALHQLLDDAGRQIEDAFRQTTINDLTIKRRAKKACTFPKRT